MEVYIREKNLYAADYKTIVGDIREFVKNRLSEKRWKHTLGVEKMAIELARKYDANMEVCSVAALAHDMGRGFDKDIYEKLINEYGIDNRYGGNLNLGHSKLGAAMAAKIFYIEDEKIINAIAYHTTEGWAPDVPRPRGLEQMLALARELGKGFACARA